MRQWTSAQVSRWTDRKLGSEIRAMHGLVAFYAVETWEDLPAFHRGRALMLLLEYDRRHEQHSLF